MGFQEHCCRQLCVCVCVFLSLRAKQAECGKHLFNLYVYFVSRGISEGLCVCMCVCRSEYRKPHLTVYNIRVLPSMPVQSSPRAVTSHSIYSPFTLHSRHQDSTVGCTLQHQPELSGIRLPWNLHFMSTLSINTIDFHTMLVALVSTGLWAFCHRNDW